MNVERLATLNFHQECCPVWFLAVGDLEAWVLEYPAREFFKNLESRSAAAVGKLIRSIWCNTPFSVEYRAR